MRMGGLVRYGLLIWGGGGGLWRGQAGESGKRMGRTEVGGSGGVEGFGDWEGKLVLDGWCGWAIGAGGSCSFPESTGQVLCRQC